jgi:hypothetical protein
MCHLVYRGLSHDSEIHSYGCRLNSKCDVINEGCQTGLIRSFWYVVQPFPLSPEHYMSIKIQLFCVLVPRRDVLRSMRLSECTLNPRSALLLHADFSFSGYLAGIPERVLWSRDLAYRRAREEHDVRAASVQVRRSPCCVHRTDTCLMYPR